MGRSEIKGTTPRERITRPAPERVSLEGIKKVELTSPLMRFERIESQWKGPKTTVPFVVNIDVNDAIKKAAEKTSGPGLAGARGSLLGAHVGTVGMPKVLVELWTNVGEDNPRCFHSRRMRKVATTDGHDLTFKTNLPIPATGTYKATARVSLDGGKTWNIGGEIGLKDIAFRSEDPRFDSDNIYQLFVGKIASEPGSKDKFSTVEDLLDHGNAGLKRIKDKGFNVLYVEDALRADPWTGDDAKAFFRENGRDPDKMVGSPFAATCYHSFDPRKSRAARDMNPNDVDGQLAAANASLKTLCAEAEKLGMDVIIGIAPNHTGHNFHFRDVVETPEGLKVVNDFSQVAVRPEQLEHVKHLREDLHVADHEKRYAEDLFPWLFSTPKSEHLDGANNRSETFYDTWYGPWRDTVKLEHGGFGAHGWYDRDSPQIRANLGWQARNLAHLMTLGVKGFRIDHGNGMSRDYFDYSLTEAQRIADRVMKKHVPVRFYVEDHDRQGFTNKRVTGIQSEGWTCLVKACREADIDEWFRLLYSPGFLQILQADNHDNRRALERFDGDLMGLGRYTITTMLAGGPFSLLMGTELGEPEKLDIMTAGGVNALDKEQKGTLPGPNKSLEEWVAAAGKLKTTVPALMTKRMNRLYNMDKGNEPQIIAMARHGASKRDNPVLVFSNLNNTIRQEATYGLDSDSAQWVDRMNKQAHGKAKFQVRNLLSGDPTKGLWAEPRSAEDLYKYGLRVGIDAYHVQALELYQVKS